MSFLMEYKKWQKVTFIDLFLVPVVFCGLEMAVECKLGVDFNKDAIETFELNHPLVKVIVGTSKN